MKWSKAAVAERAELVQRTVSKAFPKPEIPLTHSSSFELLVAVVLSAQCTDKRVNEVTPALFARANTPQKLSKLKQPEVFEFIKTCGLGPIKSKNLIALSQQLVDLHGGDVPNSREALEALPGVGRKTANVILSQAFGVPAMPVDTHILRSGQRWGLTKESTPEGVEEALCALYPQKLWNPLHLQIIYYARAFCTARGCHGPTAKASLPQCPLCRAIALLEVKV